MKLLQIRLKNFRNFLDLDLRLNPGVNVITGDNGAGKTSLLEAIQVLLTSQSFRCNQMDLLVNQKTEGQGFVLAGQIEKDNVTHSVQSRFDGFRRSCFIDQKKVSGAQMQKQFSVILFSPESLASIKSGPAARRQLLDEMCLGLYPSIYNAYTQYNKCLRTRNQALKDLLEYPGKTENLQVLESIDKVFLPLAAQVTLNRLKGLQEVQNFYSKKAKNILKNQDVDISVDYLVSSKSAVDWTEDQVYDALNLRMKELAAAERASGQSLVGPHKHEVKFLFQGQDSRSFCSQGQQRSLVLAFKMAQVQVHREIHGEYPILLLDDLLSELDIIRQESLLGELQVLDAQIFMTNTVYDVRNVLSGKSETVFEIENGRLKEKEKLRVREPNTTIY